MIGFTGTDGIVEMWFTKEDLVHAPQLLEQFSAWMKYEF